MPSPATRIATLKSSENLTDDQLERLARVALLALRRDGDRALALAETIDPFEDMDVERFRQSARAMAALKSLEKIAGGVKSAALGSIISAAKSAKLKPGNASGLNGAADKIRAAGRKFAANQDGSGLASVDSMIPGSGKYMGKVAK